MKQLNVTIKELILVAAAPATLHKIHLAKESDARPLCGTKAEGGFECVGNVEDDGARHINSCMRCLHILDNLTDL